MMPSRHKGSYTFRPTGKCSKQAMPLLTASASTMQPVPSSTAMASTVQSSGTIATNENHPSSLIPSEVTSNIPVWPEASHIPLAGGIRASVTPSALSLFLSPSENGSGNSVLTSVSRGKHKASAISGGESAAGTTVSEVARKCNRGQPLASVVAQKEHTEAMKDMPSVSVDGLSWSMANQTLTTNNDVFRQAALAFRPHSSNYSVEDALELGTYITAIENKQEATLFPTLDEHLQKSLLDRCLQKINARRDRLGGSCLDTCSKWLFCILVSSCPYMFDLVYIVL